MTRLQLTFLALVAAQAAHSVEEYRGRLYDVFPPARALTGAISVDRERGFLIANVGLVAFGVWSVVRLVQTRSAAVWYVWVWIAIELVNGVGHPAWSIAQGGYTPGVATAPLLLVLALALVYQLRHSTV